ncbi:hypothetical protein HMPREF9455_03435 [Dysgonomonas gadei ATCC BAA-286]|uniref:D-alanyl-D-alanine dipeptidase n=2 Tax=Dysgonomonas gadei TaxID=156974 RepID=F5J240_9BACT|nr:hypothetical protein HMPREF9455_03435 [Dysgonomonas gadei ATCC BAA-286]
MRNLISMMTKRRMTNRIIYFLLFLCPLWLSVQGQRSVSVLERYLQAKELVNIHTLDTSIRADLKYATPDNFTKTILYDTLFNVYMHPVAAAKLVKAQKYLKTLYPGLSLLVYDAVRPLSVQKKMYKVVQNTKYAAYVANPARTGLHNYGMAVDLTICDKNGKPLDMGTPFDFFGRAAGINKEAELIEQGVLTMQQVANRKLLRKVMTQAGFLAIRGEWWHFNAVSLTEAKQLYNVIE